MPVTTIRLSDAEKRRFTAEARRRGLSLSAYLRQAAEKESDNGKRSFGEWARRYAGVIDSGKGDLSTREGFGN